jgi:hypothetical protein
MSFIMVMQIGYYMTNYKEMNEQQKKIIIQLKKANEINIKEDKTRINGIKRLLNGGKITHYVCQFHTLNSYLKPKKLFIYDVNCFLYDFKEIEAHKKGECRHESSKRKHWLKWEKDYLDILPKIESYVPNTKVHNPHKYMIELIKVLFEQNFLIQTEKIDSKSIAHDGLLNKESDEYLPTCKDLENIFMKKFSPNQSIDESQLFDLFEKETDKQLSSNWRKELKGKCFPKQE